MSTPAQCKAWREANRERAAARQHDRRRGSDRVAARSNRHVGPEDGTMSQAEVAVALGLSRPRIGQIERAVLAKFRAVLDDPPPTDRRPLWQRALETRTRGS